MVQAKSDMGLGERHPLKLVYNMAHLCRVAFQEVTARRGIVKKIFNSDAGSVWCSYRLLLYK
ncbi:hypothetical protein D9M68_732110 [compost metagenome]